MNILLTWCLLCIILAQKSKEGDNILYRNRKSSFRKPRRLTKDRRRELYEECRMRVPVFGGCHHVSLPN